MTLLLTVTAAGAWAQGVDREAALGIAARFFSQQPSSARAASAQADVRRAAKAGVMSVAYTSVKRAPKRRVETVPNIVVQPLVKVHWDQVGEYAKYVDPYYDSSSGVAAGCVPAAMAQIMAFWKYPARGRGFHLHNSLAAPASVDMERIVRNAANGQGDELRQVLEEYSHTYRVNFAESTYRWDEMGGEYPTTEHVLS